MSLNDKLRLLQHELNEAQFQYGFFTAAWEDRLDQKSYRLHANEIVSRFLLLDSTHDSFWAQDAYSEGEKTYRTHGHGDFHFEND